jgi:GT2 family glycosyltransferase
MTSPSTTVAIPTFCREAVLLETIEHLVSLPTRAEEVLVIDQTPQHDASTTDRLRQWSEQGFIRWVRLDRPSITAAMNHALQIARTPLVMFMDDDVVPVSDLVKIHQEAHLQDDTLWATVGQIIQPWQESSQIEPPRALKGLRTDFDFPFHSTIEADVQNAMAGNLCVNRVRALSIGGFDETFVGSAYRFETEFAKRIVNAGGRIRFLGSAGLLHLKASAGGTRSEGSHLTSASPAHGFGDYYYAFRHGTATEAWRYSGRRMIGEVRTRFHLRHPWWIPVKLLGEFRALVAGFRAATSSRKTADK